MGSVKPYETANGRRYRVQYRKPDQTNTTKRGFTTKKAAELFLATVDVDMSQGRYIDPSLAKVTLAEWLKTWLDARNDLRATTRSRVESIIDTHIRPELGNIKIGNLTRLRIQEWASGLPGAPATVRKTVNVLSGALRFAVEDGRLVNNPAHRLRLPKVVKKVRRYLNHEQVAALARAVGGISDGTRHGYHLIVLTLAYCGLRWGELSGLRIMDLDLTQARLTIRQTVVADRGYQRIEPPKDYEQRTIPIPAFLCRLLTPHIADRSPEEPVFYGIRTGTWLRNHVFRVGWFDRAAAEIGIKGLTPHEMRHTAASLAVSAGANVKAVQRMLGHASAAITLDVYSDLFDEDLDKVAISLDRVAMQTSIAELLGKTETFELEPERVARPGLVELPAAVRRSPWDDVPPLPDPPMTGAGPGL
ncbi:MAG: tyrosine-type recombinase/integrase [Microbacteriaceae bacterium]|nr:tyrosine-type recombinase/integrase [Microbacteriaceae bacterium]